MGHVTGVAKQVQAKCLNFVRTSWRLRQQNFSARPEKARGAGLAGELDTKITVYEFVKTIALFLSVALILSPDLNVPAIISFERGLSSSVCSVRFKGRAP